MFVSSAHFITYQALYKKGKPGGFPFRVKVLTQRFPGADPAAGLTILPLVVLHVDQGLLIQQVIGIDGQTGTNFFTADGHVHASEL